MNSVRTCGYCDKLWQNAIFPNNTYLNNIKLHTTYHKF